MEKAILLVTHGTQVKALWAPSGWVTVIPAIQGSCGLGIFFLSNRTLISLPCDTLHTVHSKLHSVYSIAQRRAAPLGVGMKSHPLGLCLGSMAASLHLADQNSQGSTEGTWKTTPYPTIEESKAQRNNGLWIYFNFYKFKWNFLKIWLELIWETHASK